MHDVERAALPDVASTCVDVHCFAAGVARVLFGVYSRGSVGTLRLLPRLTLSYAMVPLIAVIVGGILFSSSMFRETTLIVIPFLFIVVVLSSVGQHTTIAFTSGLICLAIGIMLAVTAPRPVVATTELSLGFALPLVNAAGTITTITVVWLISLRLVGTTRTALALAKQRTQEAERAR